MIIRAYNAERYLESAVRSVYAQTCSCPVEVLILYDEGSTDGTLDARGLRDYKPRDLGVWSVASPSPLGGVSVGAVCARPARRWPLPV